MPNPLDKASSRLPRVTITGMVLCSLTGIGPSAMTNDEPHPGAAPYRRVCYVCHDRNADPRVAVGAPRLGNQKAWESRIKKGADTLHHNISTMTYNGMKMPTGDLSPAEVKSAIGYMLQEVE